MTLDEFKQRLEEGCRRLGLPEPMAVKRGFSFAKFELKITPKISVEVYFNEETQALTSALIDRGERVFGIDHYPASGVSHLHPLGRVDRHVRVGPMQIEEILEQYEEVLRRLPAGE
jgi:hypothetical protein